MHGLYYVGQWIVVAMAEEETDNRWIPRWWVSNKMTHQSYSGNGLELCPTARAAVEAARVEAERVLATLSTSQHRLQPSANPEG
ncbi:MAG: hypothetical protein ACREUW_04910 [Burkholderiales bacterium]